MAPNLHEEYLNNYMKYILVRNILDGSYLDTPPPEELLPTLVLDLRILDTIREMRYLQERTTVPKLGNLRLAWEYAQDPAHHARFAAMFRVSPYIFQVIHALIKDHSIFTNSSPNNPQAPVDEQLAVFLYRLGRYGNGASLEDVARAAGISEGSVVKYSRRCLEAVNSLHDNFIRPLSAEEKEVEKEWMEDHLGFGGMWREGYVTYDGTTVTLYEKPGLDGAAYFTRKSNYGLNVQIGNTFSTLRIVDYSTGHTGSAHDARAFLATAAHRFPELLFSGNEFGWADSAYTPSARIVPIHRQPQSNVPKNAYFDGCVSRFRVRSEHCMGALKGCFQCLRGLRVRIQTVEDHLEACRWIEACLILHNLIVDFEGVESHEMYMEMYRQEIEVEDGAAADNIPLFTDEDDEGEEKRNFLVEQLCYARNKRFD